MNYNNKIDYSGRNNYASSSMSGERKVSRTGSDQNDREPSGWVEVALRL